ncbi:MAG: FMN-binding glutamate synthase family protein [Burkholderiaceae bacterium]
MLDMVRYTALVTACALTVLLAIFWQLGWAHGFFPLLAGALAMLGIRDVIQTRHAILKNYPIIGHLRYLFEYIRPEIRQYFFESDTDSIPFSRQQRAIVYQRAKQELDKRPFGTQHDVYEDGFEWLNHSMAPVHVPTHDFRVMIGETPQAGDHLNHCTQPYSASVFNISAMSFGSLSANAILSLNRGALEGKFAHDTGEGSISKYHEEAGGDLIWEIGSGYFGCRNPDGTFNQERFEANARREQVKMIEIKLSQGAKPGHGGMLPGPKVTPEIAAAREVEPWKDVISPSSHSAFSTPIELLEFVDRLRGLSGGKPVGFKFAMGHPWEWFAICKAMVKTGITPDFIVVDGKEGGTGAAPAEFLDRIGTPMREALVLVHNSLIGLNLRHRIKVGAAGKIVTAFDMARAMALGADWCNSGRGFMFAIGCIQAQACHTGHCPTGVTTQDPERQKALVVANKSQRVEHFHRNTLKALAELVGAAGLGHPSQLMPHHIVMRRSEGKVETLATVYPQLQPGELLDAEAEPPVFKRFWSMASAETFEPQHGF